MLKFDKELFAQRCIELSPLYSSEEILDAVIENAEKLDERLQPILDAYLKDKTIINFEFEDVCIREIMESRYNNFIQALFKMSIFLNNPDKIETFKKIKNKFFI